MNRKRRNQLAFWLGVGSLLPFAYASTYALNGAPRAEGCSGEGANPATGVVYLWAEPEPPQVGSDAFFTFRARTNEIELEQALAAISVNVTDEADQPVAGTVRVLKELESDADERSFLLGWTANGAARREGEVLKLRASATNSLETTAFGRSLTVHATDPELAMPSFDAAFFSAQLRDAGARRSCEGLDDCGGTSFGSELRNFVLMGLSGTLDEPGVLTAWEFRFEQVSGKGKFSRSDESIYLYARTPDDGDYAIEESVEFTDTVDEYCVRVVGHDLKTDTRKDSEFCAAPTAPIGTTTYDGIGDCIDAPAGFEQRWCLEAEKDGTLDDEWGSEGQRDLCAPFLQPGAGGAAGEPSLPGTAGADSSAPGSSGSAGSRGTTTPAPPRPGSDTPGSGAAAGESDAGAEPIAGAGATEDHTPSRVVTHGGCGCRTAGHPDGSHGALAVTGAFALLAGLGLRRRR